MSNEDKNVAAENMAAMLSGDDFEYDDEHLIRAAKNAAEIISGLDNLLSKRITVILNALAFRLEMARKGQGALMNQINSESTYQGLLHDENDWLKRRIADLEAALGPFAPLQEHSQSDVLQLMMGLDDIEAKLVIGPRSFPDLYQYPIEVDDIKKAYDVFHGVAQPPSAAEADLSPGPSPSCGEGSESTGKAIARPTNPHPGADEPQEKDGEGGGDGA